MIRPQLVSGLDWVKCSHQSIRGTITSNWSTNATQRQFEIEIPPNTSALIVLPARPREVLTEGGLPIIGAKGVEVLKSDKPGHHLRVGSGTYQFTLIVPSPAPSQSSQ